MDTIVQYYRICAIADPVKIDGKLNPKFYVVRGDSSYPRENVVGGKYSTTNTTNTTNTTLATKKILVIG